MNVTARTVNLAGTSYEIGKQIGKITKAIPRLMALHASGMDNFGEAEVQQAIALFDRWCPGLSEELQGFADALEAPLTKILYYGMTYLRPRPRCSQIGLLPCMTESGLPLVARNYEFDSNAEDFCLMRTSVEGKYTHMGTSALNFGRDDGFNDQGLAVTMSSCGFPVGPMPYMRAPQLAGMQFWAVTRAVLESCKNVDEALAYIKDMPIAYNLNMLLTDEGGHIALVETLDGRMAVKRIQNGDAEGYLCATNHPVLPELIPYEPKAMRHSLVRYQWVQEQLNGAKDVTKDKLKTMLLSEFPNGLSCHYYKDFFGTTKSMVIDPTSGTIDLCWGGDTANGWRQYDIRQPLPTEFHDTILRNEDFPPEMAEFLTLT